jgi:SAM-dependent methyltransferase
MASMPPRWGAGIVPSYDEIAEEYAEQYFDELDGKPFDRDVLDRFTATVKHRGRVCDLGCGPGQIARYLAAHGVDAFGIDASASMVATARRRNPTLQFHQGDLFHLPLADGTLAGVADSNEALLRSELVSGDPNVRARVAPAERLGQSPPD